MHPLQVASDRLRPKRHRAVNRSANPNRPPALDVATETGWDLDRGLHGSVLQAFLQIGIVDEGAFSAK
jgi:hypothetical protein